MCSLLVVLFGQIKLIAKEHAIMKYQNNNLNIILQQQIGKFWHMKKIDSSFDLNIKIGKRTGHIVALTGSTFQGSGMNYFLLNNALRWKKFGYRVTIICQDRKAQAMPVIDSYIQGKFPPDAPKLKNGQIRVVVPDINNLIPIYASSQYCEFPGITSKPVQQMTQDQIQTNIQMTIKCLQAIIQHDKPVKVIANYMIISGTICQRGLQGYEIPFDIITPGPALQYSVKPYPHLWKWVLPGFKKCQYLFQLTHFVKYQFLKCFKKQIEQYKLNHKIKVINPGVNTTNFQIPQSFQQCEKEFLNQVKDLNEGKNNQKQEKVFINKEMSPQEIHNILTNYYPKNEQKNLVSNLLEKWIPYSEEDETIIYVGAMINNKGMGELLAIAPKLIAKRPTLKFIFCGSGPYKEHMNQLLKSYEDGDLQLAKKIAQAEDFITEVNIQDHFIKVDKKIRSRIIYIGLATSQQILSNLLPLCTLYLCPSRMLESCSLSIIEAMCFGLTPICNDHSWYSEVLNEIQISYPQLIQVSRVESQQFYKKLPETIINTLDFIKNNKLSKLEYKNRIRQIAVQRYSWEHSALILIQLNQTGEKENA